MVAFGYLKVQVGLPVLQLLQLQRLDVEVGPLDPVLEKARSPTIFSVRFDVFLRSEWGGVKKGAKTAAMPAPFSVICFAISRM